MQNAKPGVYAIFETSEGNFTCRLFQDQAPKTVANFVGLATGTKEFAGSGGKKTKGNFYDGLGFHRVIPNFMIQGGCPEGTGRGGPGYKFEDEFGKDRVFDKPGKLAMANSTTSTPSLAKWLKAWTWWTRSRTCPATAPTVRASRW
jgi:peptidyl-prolyl cis-trans isomerase A (cyclophilin A)